MNRQLIGLGITGSIAAYKGVEIARRLMERGYDVQCVLTANGAKFITPLTLRTATRNPVTVDMFDEPSAWDVQHVSLAQKCKLFLIAPATANVIGKIACGIADDFLSTTVMALSCPVIIAPAMNTAMYENRVVQQNIDRLKGLGYIFVEPDEGLLACGDAGKGRLAAVETVVQKVIEVLNKQRDLAGYTVLVTAGPTQEAVDPVRFITNHSSGKMGYAIATVAAYRGAKVVLVSGPTSLQSPPGVELIKVRSAEQMYDAVLGYFAQCDAVIMSAAVADYRPAKVEPHKMKKKSDDLYLRLVRTRDILGELSTKKGDKVLVGFAAETDNVLENAKEKLKRKNLDMIVANDITKEDAGFQSETNIATLITEDFAEELPKMSKLELSGLILDKVKTLLGT
jgi:phosphopantothenoylcysteine decarboxylase/phosphopantothenate--cysteine ligase